MLPFDRILEHQYRTRNYQHYAVLIHDLLQDDKHDELNIKNYHQYRVEAAALPKIHHNEKKANFSKENNIVLRLLQSRSSCICSPNGRK
jgi:DNA-directed RNA polymerase subunit H (RpoH/RPB5)